MEDFVTHHFGDSVILQIASAMSCIEITFDSFRIETSQPQFLALALLVRILFVK